MCRFEYFFGFNGSAFHIQNKQTNTNTLSCDWCYGSLLDTELNDDLVSRVPFCNKKKQIGWRAEPVSEWELLDGFFDEMESVEWQFRYRQCSLIRKAFYCWCRCCCCCWLSHCTNCFSVYFRRSASLALNAIILMRGLTEFEAFNFHLSQLRLPSYSIVYQSVVPLNWPMPKNTERVTDKVIFICK